MKTSSITFSFTPAPSREISKPLVLAAGLVALAVTPWIESPSGRLLTQAAILSVGAVYFYHDRHHKRGNPFLSTEIKLPLWGKQGLYGTGRSNAIALIENEDGAPIPLSAKDTILTVHFANTQPKRRCWLCDLIQRPLILPEKIEMPKKILTQPENTFRFRYCGELVEATKSAQFDSMLGQMQAPETILNELDRPVNWTFLKESLVSTDAETLRLESGWQRYKINSDGHLTLHNEQVLSDLFRSFDNATPCNATAIHQKLKVETWPCYLMARRLTSLEEVDVLIGRNRLLIAISVTTPSASTSPLTLQEDVSMRDREQHTPKHYYYDIELNGNYYLNFSIRNDNLEFYGSIHEDLS